MSRRRRGLLLSGSSYAANAVAFDGTNDWLNRGGDLSNNADSKLWTGSLWFRRTGGVGSGQRIVEATSTGLVVDLLVTTNLFRVFARNAAGTTILDIRTSAVTNSAWHHAMWSVDLANTAKRHLYLDNAPDLAVTTYADDTADFTRAEHSVGASVTGTSKLVADLADLQMWFGKYLDLSNAANRRRFIRSGRPADPKSVVAVLGVPIVALTAPLTSDFQLNQGSGGDYTVNGALTDGQLRVELAA